MGERQEVRIPSLALAVLRSIFSNVYRDEKAKHSEKRAPWIKPQNDAFMCPVHLILAFALRRGVLKNASSLPEALHNASYRPDIQIQWASPSLPTITRSERNIPSFDAPTSTSQISHNLQYMASSTSLLHTLTSHKLRRGRARDLHHLPQATFGATDMAVGKAIKHNPATVARGKRSKYIGAPNVDFLSLKAQNTCEDNSELLFGRQVEDKTKLNSWDIDMTAGMRRTIAIQKITKPEPVR